MSSNRITFNILPADNTDTQTEMEMDITEQVQTANQLEGVVKNSPVNQEDNHDGNVNHVQGDTQDGNRDGNRDIDHNDNKDVVRGSSCTMEMIPMQTQDGNDNQNCDGNGNGNQDGNQPTNGLQNGNGNDGSFNTPQFFPSQYQSENQMTSFDNQNFCNVYVNDGINIIDPTAYSPMVYVVEGNKMIYSNSYPFVYDSSNKIHKNSSLPYAYISRNSYVKPDFNIVQNKLKLYNYWIETNDPKHTESQIVEMFGSENIYVTKSLFFRKKSSYMGEKVILISKLPQKPFKFINRINRTFTKDRRSIKSVLGDYIISPDCLFIVLAERSIDYICNNYYRYHKNERLKIETLIKSFKQKFTCINETDII